MALQKPKRLSTLSLVSAIQHRFKSLLLQQNLLTLNLFRLPKSLLLLTPQSQKPQFSLKLQKLHLSSLG
jgi:hypothetical protein